MGAIDTPEYFVILIISCAGHVFLRESTLIMTSMAYVL